MNLEPKQRLRRDHPQLGVGFTGLKNCELLCSTASPPSNLKCKKKEERQDERKWKKRRCLRFKGLNKKKRKGGRDRFGPGSIDCYGLADLKLGVLLSQHHLQR